MVTAFLLCLYALPVAIVAALFSFIAERLERRFPQQNRRIRPL